jgi:hypothetical protein
VRSWIRTGLRTAVRCGHHAIEIDLDPLLTEPATGLSHDCVAVGVVRYHTGSGHTLTSDCAVAGCQQGLLYYGKSLVSPHAPDAVQAFALQDPLFPRYPTYDQFLSEDEFDRMVDLGRSVAERVVQLQSVLDRAVAGKDRELLGLEETTLATAYGALAGQPP